MVHLTIKKKNESKFVDILTWMSWSEAMTKELRTQLLKSEVSNNILALDLLFLDVTLTTNTVNSVISDQSTCLISSQNMRLFLVSFHQTFLTKLNIIYYY